jgi:ankyrin repeat protein
VHAVLASDADPAVVAALIERGADVDAADDSGWTALHFAARDHLSSVARVLLNAGAAPDPVATDGTTPLWQCVMSNRRDDDIVRLLLAAGVNPRHEVRPGKSPLWLARETGQVQTAGLLEADRVPPSDAG